MRDQQSSLRSFLWVRKANAGKQGESKCDFLAFLTGKFPSEILSCPPRAGRPARKKCRQRNCPEIGRISRKKSAIATITQWSDYFPTAKEYFGSHMYCNDSFTKSHSKLDWPILAKKILHSEDNGQPLCIFCVADVFVIVFVLLLLLLLLLSEVQKMLHPARREERSGGRLTTIRGACSGITGRENQQSVQIT